MSFLIREVEGAQAHVVEGRAEDAGTDLPMPHDVIIEPGRECTIELLAFCTTDCDVEFMVVPRSSFAKTPLHYQNSYADGDWSTCEPQNVIVYNDTDQPYRIAAGERLFQLITRDMRHMRIKQYDDILRAGYCDTVCLRTDRTDGFRYDHCLRITAPEAIVLAPNERRRVDLGVAAVWLRNKQPHAYTMEIDEYDNVMLANDVGIIDAGYRGSLIVVLDNRNDKETRIKKGAPLVRLTRPFVSTPAQIQMVGTDHPLFAPGATARGAGAFGSTDKPTEATTRPTEATGKPAS